MSRDAASTRTAAPAAPSGGRPPAEPAARKARYLRVRLTEAEHARALAQAREAGVSVSDYARAALFGRRLARPAVPAVNLAAIGELNRLGNNLNQLLVLIYTNRAPLGLLGTLQALLRTVEGVREQLAAGAPEGRRGA